MKKSHRIPFVICLTVLLLVAAKGLVLGGEVIYLNVATTPPPSGYYALVVSMGNIVNEQSKTVHMTVGGMPGGSPAHYVRLERGQIDIGLNVICSHYELVNGIGRYEGRSYEGIRQVLTTVPSPIYVVVREDSGIKDIRDLHGKPFSPGLLGATSADIIRFSLEEIGVFPNYYEAGLDDAMDAMKDGRIVGYAKGAVGLLPDASIIEISTLVPIRILTWDPKDIETVREKYPHYSYITTPSHVFKDQGEILSMGYGVGLASTKDIPEEAIYEMLKVVMGNQDRLKQSFRGLEGVDMRDVTIDFLQMVPVKLHAGAVRYYKEMGYDIPEEVIPPEYK